MIGDLGAIAHYGSFAVIYSLIALSMLSIGVIMERLIWFALRRVDAGAFGKELAGMLARGDKAGARALVARGRSVEAKVLGEVLDWYEAGPEALGQALQSSVRGHRKQLQGGLLFLGTLGNNAPFLGLFGTVLGVVTAFQQLGHNAMGAMDNVMTGIAEALVATAVGILVALPAVAAYNGFQKRALDVEENIAQIGHLLIAQLEREREHARNRAREVV